MRGADPVIRTEAPCPCLERFSTWRVLRSRLRSDQGSVQNAGILCRALAGAGLCAQRGHGTDLALNGDTSRTIVTDRNEISEDDVEDPLAHTNRGTLQPGETVDIGSLADIVNRARISLRQDWTTDHINTVTISVVTIAGQAAPDRRYPMTALRALRTMGQAPSRAASGRGAAILS
ncbi:hypothetical protein [Roseinatronobacter sp.]|uniref:hypothetical protein n=1 Tax=Roseinatronobacter sp. TaxID=1945755 RepID=UPI0025D393C6|nr:hypothetical protein [Rhodobaca sp.]